MQDNYRKFISESPLKENRHAYPTHEDAKGKDRAKETKEGE